MLIYACCLAINCRTILQWGHIAYIGVLMLLVFTMTKGSVGMGAQRWINLVFIKVQPSELAKLFFPFFSIAWIYDRLDDELRTKDFLPLLGGLIISFIVIVKQPDLGTALIILISGLIICYLAGLSHKFFITLIMVSVLATPLLWHTLKPYQKKRIAVFLGHGQSHKERYQTEQAIIAIGSGGLWGKGFLHGTQNKLQFLPEGRTDFIFAVICEEWGFIGALLVIVLYGCLFMRIIRNVCSVKKASFQLFAISCVIHIMLSTIINIAMVLGLLPIVGIPLPLMSYGISNLWITLASLGIFQNIVTTHGLGESRKNY